ncbi:MAG: tRNA (adenosine(37)-N6)-threonylcarbamoyltransferase complex transferase subunit TsaD [Patescibacteria group bacterium UBA2163]
MKILAIETSCDETAITVLEATGNIESSQYTLLGDSLYSQASKHSEYGGVYPSLAKREHQQNLVPLTTETLRQAGLLKQDSCNTITDDVLEPLRDESFKKAVNDFLETTEKPDIDLIAVTNGPGLEPALWTGVTFAQALSAAWDIPLTGIDHMEGHITSALLKKDLRTPNTYHITDTALPLLALLISGGHTELITMKEWFAYNLVGQTRDDAVGEAFDKVARLLGLEYPGGPEISAYATKARERGGENPITLPRPMLHEESCDVSFSGLKTAVLYLVRDMGELSQEDKENIAREFEDAARDVLVHKTKRAIEIQHPKTLVVGGGVAANTHIREGLEELVSHHPNITLHYPESGLTGDNAIMIGIAAYLRHSAGKADTEKELNARGSQSLAE